MPGAKHPGGSGPLDLRLVSTGGASGVSLSRLHWGICFPPHLGHPLEEPGKSQEVPGRPLCTLSEAAVCASLGTPGGPLPSAWALPSLRS